MGRRWVEGLAYLQPYTIILPLGNPAVLFNGASADAASDLPYPELPSLVEPHVLPRAFRMDCYQEERARMAFYADHIVNLF